MIAEIAVYDGTGKNVPTAPMGWGSIRNDSANPAGNHITSWLFYKVVTGSDLSIAFYDWTLTTPQYAAGIIGDWRGASSSPLDQSSGAAAGGGANPIVLAAPSLTPFANGELQVYFYGTQNFAAPTLTEPPAINDHFNVMSSKEGFTLGFGDLSAPFAGQMSPIYNASSKFPATGTPMGFPVLTAQAVLLIPAGTPPTSTPTETPVLPPTRTPTPTSTPTPTMTPVPSPTATPVSSIQFVNTGGLFDSSSPVTTITVGVPSGTVAGDLLIAQILIYDGTGTNTPSIPGGWSFLRHDFISNGGNQLSSWLYYKVAASEPGSYNWSISQQYAAGVMGAWSGVGSPFLDGNSGATISGNPAVVAAPSLTPSHSGEMQVYFYGAQNLKAPNLTQSSAIVTLETFPSSKEGFTLAFGQLAAPFQGNASPTYNATATGSGPVVLSAQAVLLVP